MERTVKQRTNKPKLFRWALWWGLGIIAVCLTIIIIKGESLEGFDTPLMDAIYSMVYRFGILPIVLYIGIIGPVMEEFVFRLWGNGKLWTGITSIILMALFALAVGWWLSLLTIVCGVSILVYFRDDRSNKFYTNYVENSYFGNVAGFANQAMFYDVWNQGMDPNYDTLTLAIVNYEEYPKCHFNLTFKQDPINYHRLINTLAAILEPQGIAIEPTDRKMTLIAVKNKYNPLEELE